MSERAGAAGSRQRRRALTALALSPLLCAAAPPLSFTTLEPRFADSADLYRDIWAIDGARIVDALERHSGLAFPAAPIEVIVNGASTMTALDGRTIRMRAGYPSGFAKGTLAHELGHRLAIALPRTAEIDDHRVLYLFLYDAWAELYGRDFADAMVQRERQIRSTYDYDAAWQWALSMTRTERQSRLKWLRSGLRMAGGASPAVGPAS